MRRIDSPNFDKEIKNIVENIIPGCSTINIRVGYFFFSGFSLISKAIAAKNVKILVGIGADQKIVNLKKNIEKRRIEWFERFVQKVDEDNILGKSDEQEAYFIFKEKLLNGSLQIRQQNEEDHSKEFIFEFTKKYASEKKCPGNTLSGSTNLSESGFILRGELNHLFDEEDEFKIANDTFKNKWNNSIPLIDKVDSKQTVDDFLKYSKRFHFEQTPKPYYMFVRILDEYFKDRSEEEIKYPKTITKNYFENYKYQKDAISKGIDIVKEHNGVLLSDVVGLGKSIIASSIAHNLKLKTIVICPPHLEDQWRKYLLTFDVNHEVYRSGSVHKALDDLEDVPGQKLIIVDEVHKFRNDETKDYLNLYQLCHSTSDGQPNKVLLLSATPFNNRPKDTFSLLKLFQIPTRSTLQTINNLTEYFEELTKKYNKLKNEQDNKKRDSNEIKKDLDILGSQIRNLISPVMIRRSRLDLEKIKAYDDDLKKQGIRFPIVKDPILLTYKLNEIEEIYKNTLKLITPTSKDNKYKCARYKPISYVKPENLDEILIRAELEKDEVKLRLPKEQQNIADFIKRLMVRRFESSSYSFYKTLSKMISSSEKIINFYEKGGFIPIYRKGELPDVEEIFDLGTEDNTDIDNLDNIENDKINKLPRIEKLKEKGLWWILRKELKTNYIVDVKKDLSVLLSIKQNWEIINKKGFIDPKVKEFKNEISHQIKKDSKRKIIVFTEFSDTANYLYKEMKKDNFRVDIYTSKESTNKKNKNRINENFDASVKDDKQKNDFDILIATDAISEGFNLHRGGTIFNYDIPYNPTRVVQRFGRINRISKKQLFKELYIYNYFPTETGESELNMRGITGLKKMMFNSIFGEDTRVLTKNEDLSSFFKDEFEKLYKETESPETHFENIIYELRDYSPEIIMEAQSIAKRVKSKRKIKKYEGFIAFSKKGDIPKFTFLNIDQKFRNINDIDALKIYEADKKENYLPFDKKYNFLYEKLESKIFEEKPVKPFSKKRIKLIEKLELVSLTSKYNEYYQMMFKVVRELGGLTPFQEKLIRNTSEKNFDKNIKKIQEIIPKKFLKNLINTYDNINKKNETLIITQQLND